MIDRDAAIAIVRDVALEDGWALLEPIEALLRRSWLGNPIHWEIRTNTHARGGPKARYVVDAIDGRVIDKGYVPL